MHDAWPADPGHDARGCAGSRRPGDDKTGRNQVAAARSMGDGVDPSRHDEGYVRRYVPAGRHEIPLCKIRLARYSFGIPTVQDFQTVDHVRPRRYASFGPPRWLRLVSSLKARGAAYSGVSSAACFYWEYVCVVGFPGRKQPRSNLRSAGAPMAATTGNELGPWRDRAARSGGRRPQLDRQSLWWGVGLE